VQDEVKADFVDTKDARVAIAILDDGAVVNAVRTRNGLGRDDRVAWVSFEHGFVSHIDFSFGALQEQKASFFKHVEVRKPIRRPPLWLDNLNPAL
jgi:hypothetical protein